MKHFIDNSIAPIIAIDFDGTISVGENQYPDPHNGTIRPYAKEVINFLHDVGVKVVIWTNRKNVKGTDIKDKLLMKQWLEHMGVKYDTVNDSTKFAPYKYYGRKLYAHMFVDDRGYGWDDELELVMVYVLRDFLIKIIGCEPSDAYYICDEIANKCVPHDSYTQRVKELVANWNKDNASEGDIDA